MSAFNRIILAKIVKEIRLQKQILMILILKIWQLKMIIKKQLDRGDFQADLTLLIMLQMLNKMSYLSLKIKISLFK